MIIVFSKTIVFFLISLLYFYSLTGFGKLIDNTKSKSDKNFNFFELAIYGIILQLILGWSIYYTFGTNAYLNILILIFGLILYFFYKKNLNLINKKYLFFLLLLTFSVLIISKTHEDFNEYHLFSINEIFTNQLRIGVTNLNFKFFHSSLLAYNQSLFVLPYFNYVLIHLPIFFIYFLCLGYFFFICFKTNNDSERFYSLVIISLLLIKFNRMSEFGYDYISHFLLLIVFHKIFFFSNEKIELIKVFKIFTLCILIKPTSLLFSPIVLYLFYKNKFKFLIDIYYSKIFILSFMLIILFSTSFSRTGCLFYPVNLTCFSSEKIFWSEKNKIKEHSELVSLWAKEYYNKDKSKYPKITDKNIYKKNFNWFKYWLEGHFFYKISEFLIILISIIVLIYIYISKERLNFKKISRLLCNFWVKFFKLTVLA